MDPSTENADQQNTYNILLLGETGSGKSTLINYLTNYFRNGSLDDLKIAIPTKYYQETEGWAHSEKDLADSTKSKTRKCTLYDFDHDGLHYVFIDTPGLSDTSGTNNKTGRIRSIMAAAEKAGTITAIMLVINGSVARDTVNLRNTIALVKTAVPDVLLTNIIVVLTNCSVTSVNFDLRHLEPWIIPAQHVFYMNNSALSKPVRDWIDDEDMREDLNYQWGKSMKEIQKMMTQINILGPIASIAFSEMREQRNEIKAELNENMFEMKKFNSFQNTLYELQNAHDDASASIEAYSNYKKNVQVETESIMPTRKFHLICKKHMKSCCESECKHRLFPKKNCVAFNGTPNCNSCGCDKSSHFAAQYKLVKTMKSFEIIMQEAKNRYDEATANKAQIEDKISNLRDDIQSLRRVLDKKAQKILGCCEKLKKICSQFNFADELANIIATMKSDALTISNMDARAEAEARIESIRRSVDSLSETVKADFRDSNGNLSKEKNGEEGTIESTI